MTIYNENIITLWAKVQWALTVADSSLLSDDCLYSTYDTERVGDDSYSFIE